MDRDERSEKHYPFDTLSKREMEVAVAIAIGWHPHETADVLGIAVKSYGTYRGRIMEKLHLRSNAQLAVMAFEVGLIPSVLKQWKEDGSEHIARNGGGSLPEAGREGGLLPGTETDATGQGGHEALPGSDKRDATPEG